jgi:hypothetical protein
MWDAATQRHDKRDELGTRFEGLVTFEDSRKHKFENPAILDWDSHFDTLYVGDSPNESAKAITEKLGEIASVIKSYKGEHSGIWVYPLSGDDERQYRQTKAAEQHAASGHLQEIIARAQLRATQNAANDKPAEG